MLEQNGTDGEDIWESAVSSADDAIILAGRTTRSWAGASMGDFDFAALSLDATGTPLWSYEVSAFQCVNPSTTIIVHVPEVTPRIGNVP